MGKYTVDHWTEVVSIWVGEPKNESMEMYLNIICYSKCVASTIYNLIISFMLLWLTVHGLDQITPSTLTPYQHEKYCLIIYYQGPQNLRFEIIYF